MRYTIFFLSLLAFSCTANSQNKLKPDAFEQMLKSDATVQLIDVRTPSEFQGGHIDGALNLNIQDAEFAQKMEQLDKNRPVMVYCAKGSRSADAATRFNKAGFPKVYDLKGGITAWQSKGKSVKQ